MTTEERLRLFEKFVADQREILNCKGYDYAETHERADVHNNFRTVGGLLSISPLMTNLVYMMKHICALITYARSGKKKSEDLRSRCMDIANYAFIFWLLTEEGQ